MHTVQCILYTQYTLYTLYCAYLKSNEYYIRGDCTEKKERACVTLLKNVNSKKIMNIYSNLYITTINVRIVNLRENVKID